MTDEKIRDEKIRDKALKYISERASGTAEEMNYYAEILTEFAYNMANEWHKADIPTSQINKVVLGYIKDYNSKMFCLVKWNGKWWYDARTYNDRVKLLAWREIVLPKESEND